MSDDKGIPQKKLGDAINEVITALTGLKNDDRLIVVKAVCEHLGIALTKPESQTLTATQETPSSISTQIRLPDTPQDIRSLKEQKQPSAATEMAAIVAFYLAELAPPEGRKRTVNKNDLEKYFKQAGFRLPEGGGLTYVLPNAKSAGYFDSPVEPGEYPLNPVGYNLVAHSLPRASGAPVKKRTPKKPVVKKTPKKNTPKKPTKKDVEKE